MKVTVWVFLMGQWMPIRTYDSAEQAEATVLAWSSQGKKVELRPAAQ